MRGWTCCSGPARSLPRNASSPMSPPACARCSTPASPFAPRRRTPMPGAPPPSPSAVPIRASSPIVRYGCATPARARRCDPISPSRASWPPIPAMPRNGTRRCSPARGAPSRTASSAWHIRSPARSMTPSRRAPTSANSLWASATTIPASPGWPVRWRSTISAGRAMRSGCSIATAMVPRRRPPSPRASIGPVAPPRLRATRRQRRVSMARQRVSPTCITASSPPNGWASR